MKRRGYMLIQLVLTLLLTSLALWLGTALIIRLWNSSAQAAEHHSDMMAFEQMTRTLRADITHGEAQRQGGARWRLERQQLIRIEGDDTRSWDAGGTPALEPVPGGMILTIDDDNGSTARIPMIDPVRWAREVAP
jgi:type II secretory pathway component PulJ